jgi:hypothetical protein
MQPLLNPPNLLPLLEDTRQRARQTQAHTQEMRNRVARTITTIARTEDMIMRTDAVILSLREACVGSREDPVSLAAALQPLCPFL